MSNKFNSEPRLILAHKCNVNVNMLASQLIEQLQKLIDIYGDGDVDYDTDFDGNEYVFFRAYRMETPEEVKIRYDRETTRHRKDMEREREIYERLKEKYG